MDRQDKFDLFFTKLHQKSDFSAEDLAPFLKPKLLFS